MNPLEKLSREGVVASGQTAERITTLAAIAAILTALWAVIIVFNPIGKVDLTIRIDKEISITLPSVVEPLPVHLVFEGKNITRASIVQLEIVNSGSSPIGADDKNWRLDLKSTHGVTMVPFGVPRKKPTNLAVAVAKSASPDVISLEVGLFNPADSIGLDLILIDPPASEELSIIPQARVPGLSQPTIGRLSVIQRIQQPFAGILLLPMLLLMLWWVIGYNVRNEGWDSVFSWSFSAIRKLATGIFASLFGALLISIGISWGLALIASVALNK